MFLKNHSWKCFRKHYLRAS